GTWRPTFEAWFNLQCTIYEWQRKGKATDMDRPPHAGLRHLALNARALDRMKRFYVDVLGFAVEWEPDADNVYLSSGADNLALHRAHEGTPAGESQAALDHLGLIVREPEDVDRWATFLEAR